MAADRPVLIDPTVQAMFQEPRRSLADRVTGHP
jgi:hypothetical protein